MRTLLVSFLLFWSATAAAEGRDDRVTIKGDFGEAHYAVDVADDGAERAQGLMNVPEMGTLEGMLFVYDKPGRRSFWMENTLIPLDMIFAGADGTITYIHENAVPLDRTPIPGGAAVQFVLDVNGGLTERLGIEVGDAMQHPAIGGGRRCPASKGHS